MAATALEGVARLAEQKPELAESPRPAALAHGAVLTSAAAGEAHGCREVAQPP